MLALPAIGAAPRMYTTAQINPLAAKMALALAGDAEIRAPRRPREALEVDVLRGQIEEWRAHQLAGSKLIAPTIHVALGQGPISQDSGADTYTVWLGNGDEEYVGSVWHLERRWRAIENSAPGLAAAALKAIGHCGLHSFPVYAPGTALYWASMNWWMGEEDERYILAEYQSEEGNEGAPPPDDMPTRAWLDKLLPRAVTIPHSKLKRAGLERLVRRRGDVGEIARLVLAIDDACKASHRRKSKFEIESQDENGFQAIGFCAALRWNARDPMFRIFDDYVNGLSQSEGCNEAYGWVTVHGAQKLPALLAELEHRFALLRLMESLIPLVATRARPNE